MGASQLRYTKENPSLETLAGLSAGEVTIPAGGKCATLAAQVKHTVFYLEIVDRSVHEPVYPELDWREMWRTVDLVSKDEWAAIQVEPLANYNRIFALVKEKPAWSSENVDLPCTVRIKDFQMRVTRKLKSLF